MTAKKKILLVDDEQAILKVFSIKLRISGYDVITASGGQEAIELVASAKPDIMVLDIVMPGIDGFEVLQKLRSHSQLPVIALSARQDFVTKARELGANDFLAKPLVPDELLKKIRAVLGA
jgi:DNA-binding response OmpR family regulator